MKPDKPVQEEILKELKLANGRLNRYVDHKQVFIRGILNGLGGILGATVILAILLSILSQLEFVPLIGNFAVQVTEFIEANTN